MASLVHRVAVPDTATDVADPPLFAWTQDPECRERLSKEEMSAWETPVEWVLLWDVSQLFPCTAVGRFGVLSGVRAHQKRLSGLWSFFSAPLQDPPFVHSYFEQALICAHHRSLEGLAILPRGPPHRELYRCRHWCSRAQTSRYVVGLFFTRVGQHHQKFVSTYTDDRFLGADVSHEKAGHFHQNTIAVGMAVGVVVLLEVVDIEINASPLSLWLRLALTCYRIQISSIVAPSQRIPDTELQ